MTWNKLSVLLIVALLLACGQVSFKAAAQSIKGPVGFDVQTTPDCPQPISSAQSHTLQNRYGLLGFASARHRA